MQIDSNTNLGLCLNAAIRSHDADMLRSLIEANSADEKYVRNFTNVYRRLSVILSEADKEWFRQTLGGSKAKVVVAETIPVPTPPPYFPHPKDTLIPAVELAKILQIATLEFYEYLSSSSHTIYCFGKQFEWERSAVAFEDVVAIASGLQVFLVERQVDYYLNKLKIALTN